MPRALLAAVLLLIAVDPATGQQIDRLQWRYQSVSWYSRFSLNATLGPVVAGQTAIFGGVYTYRNAKSSALSAIDLGTGRSRWRVARKGELGPMAVGSGAIVLAAGDDVLLLELASGRQRWKAPVVFQHWKRSRILGAHPIHGAPAVDLLEPQIRIGGCC